MKDYLVAGGAGFIGANLVRRLLEDGNRVVVIDNLSTGMLDNVKSFERHPNYKFYYEDIASGEVPNLDEYCFDVVFNLACPANPPYCFSHSIEVIKTNIYGTFNLVDIAMKNNSRFFQSSTSEVYGNPDCAVQEETYNGNVNPYGIRACYDEGKRCAETILYDYNRYHNLDVRVARIFNTYGPHMNPNDGRCIVQFFLNALKNEPIIIYGDGQQTRSFCYIDDLIDGILKLVDLDKMPTTPINIGNPENIKIEDLARKIISLTKSKSKIIYRDETSDDPRIRRPSIERAKKTLDWSPKVSLEEGLNLALEYFKFI